MAELRQRQPIIKRSGRRTRAEVEAQEHFKREVARLDMGKCIGEVVSSFLHECSGPKQAHHCIRQQTIRAHISTLRLSEEERLEWLWDPDLAILVCGGLHAMHTARLDGATPFRIPLEWLPARVVDRAEALHVRHLLEREHPPSG